MATMKRHSKITSENCRSRYKPEGSRQKAVISEGTRQTAEGRKTKKIAAYCVLHSAFYHFAAFCILLSAFCLFACAHTIEIKDQSVKAGKMKAGTTYTAPMDGWFISDEGVSKMLSAIEYFQNKWMECESK